MRVTVHSAGRPGAGIGCLGSIVSVLVVAAVIAAIVLGAFVLLAVVAAATVIVLIALGVDRLVMALNPRYRRHRRGLRQSGQVIDTTANLEPPRPNSQPEEP